MTAVADAPAEPTATGPERMPSAPRRAPDPGPLLPELSLLLLTVIATLALRRIFADASYLPDVLLAGAGAHVLAMTARRIGLGAITSSLASVAMLALVVSWARLPDTLLYGLPTGTTVDELRAQLTEAWDQFGVVKAPVEVTGGFVIASMIAIWVFAHLADIAAFRVRSAVEAIAPTAVLFVFVGMLGLAENRIVSVSAYVAAALWFALTHRLASRPAPTRAARRRRDVRLGAGALAIAVAATSAALIGPRVPGIDEPPLFDWKSLDGTSGGLTLVSPLVDIRGRLVNQSATEVFTVETDRATYWRMASLDDFDGAVWGFSGSYQDASGDLPGASLSDAPTITQTFRISSLGGIWLPAAWSPVRVEAGADISWDPESGTLATLDGISPNESYRVVSIDLPAVLTPQLLGGAPRSADPDLLGRYTQLPEDFSAEARLLAEQLTASATNDFERADALQAYFRRFDYDLNVADGHDNGRVETFLAERRGYCEQFSGTFAAMARHLGMPARVAVGFTPGVRGEDGTYVVRGEHYHAWPEVHFEGIGWVPFEPTPGRGSPSAEPYTTIPPQQAATGEPSTATTLPLDIDPLAGLDGQGIPGFEDPAGFVEDDGSLPTPVADEDARRPAWVGRLLVSVAALGAVALLWYLGVPWARRRARRRRHERASSPSEQVMARWDDLSEVLAVAGFRRRAHETRTELCGRVASETTLDREELLPLAWAADAAHFDPGFVPGDVAAMTALVDGARRRLDAAVDGRTRLRRRLDPRPLIPGWSSRPLGSRSTADATV